MQPLALDRAHLRRIVEAAGETLAGDWLLVGGGVAALCFSPDRVTEDIDLVSLSDAAGRRYELMDFAVAQGLPVEAVNSAADFFLRREPTWADEIVLLHAGSTARIFRPTPTMFLILKIGRMSEADLDDCLAQIADVRTTGEALDVARVVARIDAVEESSEGAAARRARLRDVLARQK